MRGTLIAQRSARRARKRFFLTRKLRRARNDRGVPIRRECERSRV